MRVLRGLVTWVTEIFTSTFWFLKVLTQAFVSRQGEINMIVHDLVAAYNGSISAEWLDRQLRRDENH